MKNKVIIVGDSYTFGQGCLDREYYYDHKKEAWLGSPLTWDSTPSQHCWAALAQADFPNFEFCNISRPGNSNDNMVKQLAEVADGDTALVIFAASFHDRKLIKHFSHDIVAPWSINGQWKINGEQPQSYQDAKTQYTKHLYINEIGLNTTLMAILAGWSLAVLNQAKFAWSVPFFPNDPGPFVIPQSALHLTNLEYPSLNTYPFYKIGINSEIALAKDLHASEYGHQMYYQHEIKPLLNNLLT